MYIENFNKVYLKTKQTFRAYENNCINTIIINLIHYYRNETIFYAIHF